jgi:hypothetical protein
MIDEFLIVKDHYGAAYCIHCSIGGAVAEMFRSSCQMDLVDVERLAYGTTYLRQLFEAISLNSRYYQHDYLQTVSLPCTYSRC